MVDPDNLEFVPFAIALDMVEAAGCTANPRRFLWNALRQKHLIAYQPPFEGGPDPLAPDVSYTPDKYSERDREGMTSIDRFSLLRYLNPTMKADDKLAAAAPRQTDRPPHRPPEQREAAIAVLRDMEPGHITGSKRAVLLLDVNARLKEQGQSKVSKDTLLRAIKALNGR